MPKSKEYEFDNWIHPKNGGDDRNYTYVIQANSEKEAMKKLESIISKRSSVVDDYEFISWKYC
jgi:hypothetical protein